MDGIAQISKDRKSLRTALQEAITALDDWTNVYAPELCDPERVKEAKARISEYGTLAYISIVLENCRKAIKEDNDENRNQNG